MGVKFSKEYIKIENDKIIKENEVSNIYGVIVMKTLNKSKYKQQHLFINGRFI